MVRFEQVITSDNRLRYMLVDQHGEIVMPVMKFRFYKQVCYTNTNQKQSK